MLVYGDMSVLCSELIYYWANPNSAHVALSRFQYEETDINTSQQGGYVTGSKETSFQFVLIRHYLNFAILKTEYTFLGKL